MLNILNLYPNGYKYNKKNYIYTRTGIMLFFLSMEVSQFLKEKRKLLKLTQQDVADKAGVGIRFIRELEQGKETLQMDKVNQVLQLFGFKLGPISLKNKEG